MRVFAGGCVGACSGWTSTGSCQNHVPTTQCYALVRPLRLERHYGSMAARGRNLTRSEAQSLAEGTHLLYLDMAGTSSGAGAKLRRVKVKGYRHVGSVRLLVVELEDGSERSPSINSLFWPAKASPQSHAG